MKWNDETPPTAETWVDANERLCQIIGQMLGGEDVTDFIFVAHNGNTGEVMSGGSLKPDEAILILQSEALMHPLAEGLEGHARAWLKSNNIDREGGE